MCLIPKIKQFKYLYLIVTKPQPTKVHHISSHIMKTAASLDAECQLPLQKSIDQYREGLQ